jgi:NADH dehydrogenase (ubiquinone) 1 alpha/beta subcomplex 1
VPTIRASLKNPLHRFVVFCCLFFFIVTRADTERFLIILRGVNRIAEKLCLSASSLSLTNRLLHLSVFSLFIFSKNGIQQVSNQVLVENVPSSLFAVRAYGASGGFLDKNLVNDRIISVVKNFSKVDPAKVSATSHFGKDLGLDSLDTVEVVMAIEEEFAIEIPDAEADKILSIEEASAYIASNPDAK